jgi:hypothetical protein
MKIIVCPKISVCPKCYENGYLVKGELVNRILKIGHIVKCYHCPKCKETYTEKV